MPYRRLAANLAAGQKSAPLGARKRLHKFYMYLI